VGEGVVSPVRFLSMEGGIRTVRVEGLQTVGCASRDSQLEFLAVPRMEEF
jgi:hypothetical protein